MLGPDELKQIHEKYDRQSHHYSLLSDKVLAICTEYRWLNPKAVRAVFSREPNVKTLDSISKKIELARKSDPSAKPFRYEDLNDIAALTILCSYASDIPPLISWLRTRLTVHPGSDEEAFREYTSGHRAYHFVVRLSFVEIYNNPKLDLPCELQIKTILQEAFDAKSHDLAYKPDGLDVGDELKEQFSVLSSALHAMDRQSEFLKSLILEEEQDLALRRDACMQLYLEDYGEIPARVGLDPEKLPSNALSIFTQLEKESAQALTSQFCKFSALCALKLDNEFLKNKTLEWASKLIELKNEPKSFGVRGSIAWALGQYERAFQDMETIIGWKGDTADTDRIARAKNNLVYYVCDCKLFRRYVPEEWLEKARLYVKDIRVKMPSELDTVGLFKILFGENADAIEEGRLCLKEAKKIRESEQVQTAIANAFYSLHDHVALTKLLRLSKRSLAKAKKTPLH